MGRWRQAVARTRRPRGELGEGGGFVRVLGGVWRRNAIDGTGVLSNQIGGGCGSVGVAVRRGSAGSGRFGALES